MELPEVSVAGTVYGRKIASRASVRCGARLTQSSRLSSTNGDKPRMATEPQWVIWAAQPVSRQLLDVEQVAEQSNNRGLRYDPPPPESDI